MSLQAADRSGEGNHGIHGTHGNSERGRRCRKSRTPYETSDPTKTPRDSGSIARWVSRLLSSSVYSVVQPSAPISVFYSQDHSTRLVSITSGDHAAMGRILKRDASRLKLIEADEALGIDDGGPWIDRQMQRQHLPLRPNNASTSTTSKTTSKRPAANGSVTTKPPTPGPLTSPKPSALKTSQLGSTASLRSAKLCADRRRNRPLIAS